MFVEIRIHCETITDFTILHPQPAVENVSALTPKLPLGPVRRNLSQTLARSYRSADMLICSQPLRFAGSSNQIRRVQGLRLG